MIKKILTNVIVAIIVIIIVMANALYFGAKSDIYAESGNNTNHRNIEFDAYFKTNQGVSESIDVFPNNIETSLFIKLYTKEQGYINGRIKLKDANFEFISSESEFVNKIEKEEIVLNQINSEEYVEIEVKIKFNKFETMETEMFFKSSEITLEGIYKDSNQRDIEITGRKIVTLNFISNATNEDVLNEVSVITNKILEVNNEEKRVIQLSVQSGLMNNNYPIKEKIVQYSEPEINGMAPEISRINRNNETILTYIYPKEVKTKDLKFSVKTVLSLYDNTTVSSYEEEILMGQIEECNGTINMKIVQQEESISKGKILAGIDRPIEQTIKIYSNLKGTKQKINIKESQTSYETENGIEDANTYYVQSVLNKHQILNVLGDDGEFVILDENDNEINKVTKDTQTDENGDIIVNYEPDKIKTLKIQTSEIKQLGTISVDTTKVMKANDRNVVVNANSIYSEIEENGKKYENRIRLDEAKSQAKISINKKDIFSEYINIVEIRSELLTSNETQLLYKNPEICIVLPEEVKDVNVLNINTVYEEKLEIEKAEIAETSKGEKVVTIKLKGEQLEYKNRYNQETGVIVEADISLDKQTTSKETNLKMLYKNENEGDQIYETEEKINIISRQVTAKENIAEVNSIGKLEIKAMSAGRELKNEDEINEGQTVKMSLTLLNDTGRDLTNVKIKAKQENGIFYRREEGQREDTSTPNLELVSATRIIEDETLIEKEMISEKIGNGESFTFEYEFSVKEKPNENTTGIAVIEADGIEAITVNLLSNKIKDADLKLNIFNAKDEEKEIYSGKILSTKLNVKNIAGKNLENVIVEIPLTRDLEISTEGMTDTDNIKYIGTENEIAKFIINKIQNQEIIEFYVPILVKEYTSESKKIAVSFTASVNGVKCYSNELVKDTTLNHAVLTLEQTGSVDQETISNGQTLIYTTTIKNERNRPEKVIIKDEVPTASIVKKAYVEIGNTKIEIKDIEYNDIEQEITIPAREMVKFVIETVVDSNLAEENTIENEVVIEADNLFKVSNKVNYKIKDTEIIDPGEDPGKDPGENPGENPGKEPELDKNEISGILWIDINENGRRDENEDIIKDKQVKLLDNKTGEILKYTKTNNEGKYSFTDIENGSYIVIVEFDSLKYSVTEYKKTGVNENVNCDAISKDMNGDIVAMTDIIVLEGTNVKNIDIGFKNNKIFDMSLQKTVKRIIIQNSKGVKEIKYNNTQLAKVEIDKKLVNNTNIIVEYEIKITNEGEIAGYVNDIVEKIPNGFKLDSEMNKTWHNGSKNQLHNTSLENERINPGESKTVSIILRKSLTENNIGRFVNTAEIGKSINDLLVTDKDSTPGNNAHNEDDQSTAEVIISIKTGEVIIISIIVEIITIVLIIIAFVIRKRRREND